MGSELRRDAEAGEQEPVIDGAGESAGDWADDEIDDGWHTDRGADVLISAAELQVLLSGPQEQRPVVLDVRWALNGPPGHATYLAGHIPGAVYVDLDTELASHGPATEGRHPLPSVEALQAAARRWGVRADSEVVVYDGGGNLASARAWWLLRWGGHQRVRLLDGALPAWQAAGGGLSTEDVQPEQGDVTLSAGNLATIPLDEVGESARAGVLLDARAPERFVGEVEPVDPKAGHVPGAVSASTGLNLDDNGLFLSAEELRLRFRLLGVEPGNDVGVYCGSGVTAAHEIAALAVVGIDAALFPGSWSQWSNHDLPVETGRVHPTP